MRRSSALHHAALAGSDRVFCRPKRCHLSEPARLAATGLVFVSVDQVPGSSARGRTGYLAAT